MTVPATAEVVVIGGGVVGLAAAYYLAAAGVDVVVVDRSDLGGGSTSRAAGGVRTAFSDDVNIQLAQRSLAAYLRFEDEHEQPIDLHRTGYLFLLSTEDDRRDFEQASAAQRAAGIDSRMLDVPEAIALAPLASPDGLVGAMWSPADGHCSPESVVLGLATSARRQGASVVPHCAVTDIRV